MKRKKSVNKYDNIAAIFHINKNNLFVQGYNDIGGQRQTEIENNHNYFIPPVMMLTKFLEMRDFH